MICDSKVTQGPEFLDPTARQMKLPTEEKQPEQLTLMEIYGTVDIG